MPWGTLSHPFLFCSHSPPLLHRYRAIGLLALAMADWITGRPWKGGWGIAKPIYQLAEHLQFIFCLEKDELSQLGFHSWESKLRDTEKSPSQWWVLVLKGQVSPGRGLTSQSHVDTKILKDRASEEANWEGRE